MTRVGPASPCINVCVLDAGNCCTGCGRTVVEIARWGRMNPDEQWAVLARLERARARPLGFVASDYALAIWGLGDISALIRTGRLSLDALFDEDMLGDDLEDWLYESQLMRRTFRNCAIIAGLIERRHPGKEKTGRQITVSSDIIYDVLYEHEPDHILIQATRHDAARGLLDIERLGHMLARIRHHIVHKPLDRISPLAVPILLDIGKARPVLDDPILGPDKFIRPHPAQHRPRHCQPWGQRARQVRHLAPRKGAGHPQREPRRRRNQRHVGG